MLTRRYPTTSRRILGGEMMLDVFALHAFQVAGADFPAGYRR